jgi:hypothetical protein
MLCQQYPGEHPQPARRAVAGVGDDLHDVASMPSTSFTPSLHRMINSDSPLVYQRLLHTADPSGHAPWSDNPSPVGNLTALHHIRGRKSPHWSEIGISLQQLINAAKSFTAATTQQPRSAVRRRRSPPVHGADPADATVVQLDRTR